MSSQISANQSWMSRSVSCLGPRTSVWARLSGSVGDSVILRFLEERASGGHAPPRKGYLLISGDYFIFARDRAVTPPKASSLTVLLEEPNLTRDQIIDILDFEISFGRKNGGKLPWEIQLSTLPFKEGHALFLETTWALIAKACGQFIQREHTDDGMIIRRWSS